MKDEKAKTEETTDEMKVVVTKKEGCFTRMGKFLDRHKKKVAIGAAAFAGTVGMLIFVGRNRGCHDGDDPILLEDDGFTVVDSEGDVD